MMKLISRLLIAVALLTSDSFALADQDHGDHGHGDRRWRGEDHRRYSYRDGGHRYDGPTYVVRNYGYCRLLPPPRGYHWVRADYDYLLVAMATGVILDMALH